MRIALAGAAAFLFEPLAQNADTRPPAIGLCCGDDGAIAIDRLPFPRVVCDDAIAAEQAVGHLLSLGHTRIGFVLGPSDHLPSTTSIGCIPLAPRLDLEMAPTVATLYIPIPDDVH